MYLSPHFKTFDPKYWSTETNSKFWLHVQIGSPLLWLGLVHTPSSLSPLMRRVFLVAVFAQHIIYAI